MNPIPKVALTSATPGASIYYTLCRPSSCSAPLDPTAASPVYAGALAVNPKPFNPKPATQNPQPSTSNPKSQALILPPSTMNPRRSTLSPQPSTLNHQVNETGTVVRAIAVKANLATRCYHSLCLTESV